MYFSLQVIIGVLFMDMFDFFLTETTFSRFAVYYTDFALSDKPDRLKPPKESEHVPNEPQVHRRTDLSNFRAGVLHMSIMTFVAYHSEVLRKGIHQNYLTLLRGNCLTS
jgi:hypothetical protein